MLVMGVGRCGRGWSRGRPLARVRVWEVLPEVNRRVVVGRLASVALTAVRARGVPAVVVDRGGESCPR